MEQRVSHSLVQALRAIPDFASLDERTLLAIVGESMNLFWKKGNVVFERGTGGDAFYVIVSGEVSVQDEEGNEVTRFGPGDSFGEISLLLNTTHQRNAVAATDCELLVLPKDAFSSLLGANPELDAHFKKVLEDRKPPLAEAAPG